MFLLKESFSNYQISITEPKTFAPEQFEEIFKEIIGNITKGENRTFNWIKEILSNDKKYERVVIVIDNIDHCDQQTAHKLLTTIKNFLEVDKVIFIIPVDEEQIIKFMNAASDNAKEYLRKIFNSTLRLKVYSDNELYEFASTLKNKYELSIPNEVLSIICQEFSKNPRRIIQFLNTLQTEITLVEKQEQSDLIPRGSVTDNIPFLTKLLIIKEEWPDFYNQILDDFSIMKKINKAFRDNTIELSSDNHTWFLKYEDNSTNVVLNEDMYRFFMRTQNIDTSDLEPFLLNRDLLRGIPDEIKNLIISQDWIAIKKMIDAKETSFDTLMKLIADKLEDDVIKRGLFKTTGFNILSLVFKIVSDDNYSKEVEKVYSSRSFETIKSVVNSGKVRDLYPEFDAFNLCNFSKLLRDKGSKELSDNILTYIKQYDVESIYSKSPDPTKVINPVLNKNLHNLIIDFIKVFKEKDEVLENFKTYFTNIIIINPDEQDIVDIIEDPSLAKILIDNDIIENLLDSIVQDIALESVEGTLKIIRILNNHGLLSDQFIEKYVLKLIPISNVDDWNHMKFWLNALVGFISKIDKNSKSTWEQVYNLLNGRNSFLYNAYNQNHISEIHLNCYKSFLEITAEFYRNVEADLGYDDQVIDWMNNIFNQNRSEEIYTFANKKFEEIIDKTNPHSWPFADNMINRFKTMPSWEYKKEVANTINLMMQKTDKEDGLEDEQIELALDNYIELINDSDQDKENINETIASWLSAISKNNNIVKIVTNRISIISEVGKQKILLKVVKDIGDISLLNDTINNILANKNDDELIEEIEYLENEFGLSENNIENLIDKKVKTLIASDNKIDQLFGINILNSVNRIPDSDKTLLKSMLDDINKKDYEKEEEKLLVQAKKKVK